MRDYVVATVSSQYAQFSLLARHLYIDARSVHNMYMMAAGWRLVGDLIRDLIDDGLDDVAVKAQLKSHSYLRSQFLVLYDTVNILVQAGQANFAILASSTSTYAMVYLDNHAECASAEHYGQYFNKITDPDTEEAEYVFDWGALKHVHKSFLDSLIVELCLPNSPIPKLVLYQLLSETVEESPREAKQFSQAVWDAVGDLSVGSFVRTIFHRYTAHGVAIARPLSNCSPCWRAFCLGRRARPGKRKPADYPSPTKHGSTRRSSLKRPLAAGCHSRTSSILWTRRKRKPLLTQCGRGSKRFVRLVCGTTSR